MYNNKELTPRIQYYMIEYIQNLDTILADLEKIDIIIDKTKSQFCCISIRTISYICDFKKRYPNTTKVLKIFDQLKCVDIITTQVSINVYIYYQIWIKIFA